MIKTDLKEYGAKRKFVETPEPRPGPGPPGDQLVFVVHKHAATRLHYDLRLEMEGVLKSWAVPRGPTLDPVVKRLAVRVEDHPLDYQDFEGIIPEGNYGAGSVIIWDRGTYRHPDAGDRKESEALLLEGLKKGNLKFILAGEKLKGEFALVKTAQDAKSWLLLKKKDSWATTGDILADKSSVASQKTLEELASTTPGKACREKNLGQIRRREAMEGYDLGEAPAAAMPYRVKPMLATLAKEPFDHPDWVFEVKWDGYRAIAEIKDSKVALYSRNLLSLKQKFAPIAESLQTLPFEAVLDGEIVVVNEQGQADFQLLQNYQKSGKGFLIYYVFDLLYFNGCDLTNLPLLKRKELLKKILPPAKNIKFSDHVAREGVLFFQVVKDKGLEGIVAKHARSPYRAARRSREWLKIKTALTQEGVIAGFTEPKGGRQYFGSLVLWAYAGDELVFIGHSGGGFGEDSLRDIWEKLQPLVQDACPFKVEPHTNAPVTWVKPQLVCEVTFSGWTGEGLMRHPVFARRRDDKDPRDVVRETPEEM